MKKGSTSINGTASPAHISGGYVTPGQMSKEMSEVNYVSPRAQGGDLRGRQRPSQEPRDLSLLIVSTSSVTPNSHQRRWSADFSKRGTSPVIIFKKNKKEPQPPLRGASLLKLHTESHSSSKRYSCPPTGSFRSPSQSSTSSSSTTSSCSSPPPVQTSVITGHDPLGWKLQPKSSSTSARSRTKRLSLQIPLPVIFPDQDSSPTSKSDSTTNEDFSHITKPALRPKPSRRHSDSSALCRSLAGPQHAVTLEELCAVHLHPGARSHESDDVFSEGNKEEVLVNTLKSKMLPPVPVKTLMARQKAQLIASLWQRSKPATTAIEAEKIYACVMKPKPNRLHQTIDQSSLIATKIGLRLDTSCDREGSIPCFPGRKI